MRGKPNAKAREVAKFGITPAGAGKTYLLLLAVKRERDHPRRCGENLLQNPLSGSREGSPPQVRGKLSHCACRELRTGITPAGAGKTPQRRKQTELFEDHPPQVRGKHRTIYCRSQQRRITPAGAGKTSRCVHYDTHTWDHPRRCGENVRKVLAKLFLLGSPPQVRGKPGNPEALSASNRITPAGAGKTPLSVRVLFVSQDHPRRCGENTTFGRKTQCRAGSPPQVRGKLLPHSEGLELQRITPAGAGKTTFLVLGFPSL